MEQEYLNLATSASINLNLSAMTSKFQPSKGDIDDMDSLSLKFEKCGESHISFSSNESEEVNASDVKTLSTKGSAQGNTGLIFPSRRAEMKWDELYVAINIKVIKSLQPTNAIQHFGAVKVVDSSARIALSAEVCILQPGANFN